MKCSDCECKDFTECLLKKNCKDWFRTKGYECREVVRRPVSITEPAEAQKTVSDAKDS